MKRLRGELDDLRKERETRQTSLHGITQKETTLKTAVKSCQSHAEKVLHDLAFKELRDKKGIKIKRIEQAAQEDERYYETSDFFFVDEKLVFYRPCSLRDCKCFRLFILHDPREDGVVFLETHALAVTLQERRLFYKFDEGYKSSMYHHPYPVLGSELRVDIRRKVMPLPFFQSRAPKRVAIQYLPMDEDNTMDMAGEGSNDLVHVSQDIQMLRSMVEDEHERQKLLQVHHAFQAALDEIGNRYTVEDLYAIHVMNMIDDRLPLSISKEVKRDLKEIFASWDK